MTKAEDKERGVLTINVNFATIGQIINSAIYHLEACLKMLKMFKDKLEVAGMKRGIVEIERRSKTERRRNIERRLTDKEVQHE